MKLQTELNEIAKSSVDKKTPIFRTTGWRPVSFFGEDLAKRKTRSIYLGCGEFPSLANIMTQRPILPSTP
ncbi:MAG: hypothetical protein O3A82_00055 [Verrucomicrobia bacterium]|jgi:hypothetical protein|nr:hypothetical protein [Verrucomicrobiota bacterium]MDA0724497.1 hypothetical protein [Verrucomicrobiota bacterium]MDA1045304.1 hypothetical protein [Verrucomicrobiota bacterium]